MTDMPPGFSPVSKEEWLEQVVKERKGMSADGLNWSIGNDVTLSPFFHKEDLDDLPDSQVRGGDRLNSFESGVFLRVEDEDASNRMALQLLQAGSNALFFDCSVHSGELSFEDLLSGIHLEYISTHFLFPSSQVASASERLFDFVKGSSQDVSKISGSICDSQLTDMPRTAIFLTSFWLYASKASSR